LKRRIAAAKNGDASFIIFVIFIKVKTSKGNLGGFSFYIDRYDFQIFIFEKIPGIFPIWKGTLRANLFQVPENQFH
jgi:hypothetical protein